ncbi:MAG TPA: penicillin acylase family protein [Gemmatimonadales bacterium]|nr:penicillin acylase family protein [Gemmatimonadales bacterium]
MFLTAFVLAATAVSVTPPAPSPAELARWRRTASRVTITRDDWGIAHIHGPTDADAVFGMLYAQAEDDFHRVETNYLTALGRTAEAEGEGAILQDLRMKLFIRPDELQARYRQSPRWLRTLMTAFADGLNYYLYTHPDVHPKVIRHFEPWMALAFSEGSIGGDIERIDLRQLGAFYGSEDIAPDAPAGGDGAPPEPTGSNGVAIAPSNTVDHHALLLINPHTSFFFRSELQVRSDEGLDAYGAVTWGQFFVYQGFNDRVGWMHTSSGVDNIDEYAETVTRRGRGWVYRYGGREFPVESRTIVVPYRTDAGMATRRFTAFFTRHGPVVRRAGGKWITVRLMQDPVHALEQSYGRTKTRSYAEFRRVMDLHTNSSNNTIYADADGHIAYFHANFIPRRDTSFDWTRPVDGSDPRTDWGPVLSVEEGPHLLDPATGWLYNSNNWPWSAAGAASPRREDYPRYVETGAAESPRGRHALRVLADRRDFTVERLRAAAYDTYLPAFAASVPALLRAWDALPEGDSIKVRLAPQVAALRGWDFRWDTASVATTLAVFWGEAAARRVAAAARGAGIAADDYVATRAAGADLLAALDSATARLAADFGSWQTPWGTVNRFQRLNDDIAPSFDDAGASLPVGFTSARWGSLASFGARPYPNTRKWYGTSGNSFVAVVEFGPRVRAIAVTAGGESGDPASPHFNDQARRYATGDLREVYYYPDQLTGHTERVYHPGE